MENPALKRTHSTDEAIENQFPVDIHAPLLDRIDMLIEAARDSKLGDDFFAKYRSLILSVAVNLQLSMEQAVLLMPFIANSDETVKYRDLRCFFDWIPLILNQSHRRKVDSFVGAEIGLPAYPI